MQDIVKINRNDNVAVALRPVSMGETICVEGTDVAVTEDIPQGHKFALRDIRSGEEVVKYGFRIRKRGYKGRQLGSCAQCKDCAGRCSYL